MSIEQFINDLIAKREARGRSPEFLAEIARENAEFETVLSDLGKNSFHTGVTILLKAPTNMFLNAMKMMYSKKYDLNDYAKDTFKLFLGKDGVAHNTLKVATNAVHLVGQGTKIGIRHLFKV